MARVASFEFYDDPVAHTNPGTCTIAWATSTVTYPGVVNLPFAVLDDVQNDIDELADQDLTDSEADTRREIYNGTTLALTMSAAVNMTTGLVTTISPGAGAFSAAKAKDLASGLRDFVLAEL